MKVVILALACVLLGLSCASKARKRTRENEKIAAWKASNPEVKMDAATLANIKAEAGAEVEAEALSEQKEAVQKGAGIVTSVLSGNIPGAVVGGVGMLGLILGGLGLIKKEGVA